MHMLARRLGAVALAAVTTVTALAAVPAIATTTSGHWEYVAAYPLTSAGFASCRSAGKLWGGTWQCRAINGPHWSHTTSHYHLEIYYTS
ncbi:hypothetical protein [Nonomuraea sp. NPDC049709]|uniref:hypothetical protein n=1 Tax=Nonomuraea sp. NPDC049709 TaxID=3154736 RepID=UPI00342F151A